MDIKELDSLCARFETGESELFELLEKECAKLIEENPEDVKLIHRYGYLFECLGKRYLKQAESIYVKALFKHNNPNNSSGFRIDGQLLSLRNTLGKNKDSIETYKKRILEYPDIVTEYTYLALAYLNADQVHEAKKVMETAQKINPELDSISKELYLRAGFYETMGEIYARLGDNEKALDCWEKSVEDQYSMGGWFSRAFLFKELGRLEEAAIEWKRIIKVLEEHHDSSYLEWPKEELAKLEEQINKK